MGERLAETLVLVFTGGVSLEQWRDSGLLTREWAMYREILSQGWYDRVVLVTYGGPNDAAVLDPLLDVVERTRVSVISNDRNFGGREYIATLPERVRTALVPGSSVVLKTNQMHGGEVAVAIRDALDIAGHPVAFIARGGYLWSRFVAHEHGPASRQAMHAAQREALLCRSADIIVGTTGRMIEDLAWRHELDPGRLLEVPNYVILDRPAKRASERDKHLILYAGQLVPRKRVDTLIRSVAMLPKHAAARLLVVGAGPSQLGLEALTLDLNAPVSFQSRMSHEELLETMGRCSIYVQASDLEGHPKTVLEAMATGAPVVVADSPGLGGVIRHGATGLKVLGDPQSFSHAMEALLADEEWRDVLGNTAARMIRDEFGLPTILRLENTAHRRAIELATLRRRAREQAA
jgi:glycosyltransferase involved in cell wall biosynthesis